MKDQIRECITDHGYTVRGAARILHIPLKDFESKLSGEQAFSLDEAHQLAELTGTTIDSLFFEDLNADLICYIDTITRELKRYSAVAPKKATRCADLAWTFVKRWVWPDPKEKKGGAAT